MAEVSEFSFLSSNGHTKVYGYTYFPEEAARGTVQIAHGIAEHCERYDAFARFLCANGFAVFIYDHIGHGRSVDGPEELGWFAEADGWSKAVEDMHTVFKMTCSSFPGVPHALFGHSMGSFLTRTYLHVYPDDFSAAVICGTAHMAKPVVLAGKALASVLAAFGPKKRSKFLNGVAFGSYNKAFQPQRTEYDWLTRDEAVVDAYMADPLCGYVATSRLYADMMGGLLDISDPENISKMNKAMPVFFIAGTMDPVGENGEGVRRAFEAFQKAGMQKAELKLYPECRHELLNELNRDEVYHDVLSWLNKNI